jgi:uncharacterized membrane protein
MGERIYSIDFLRGIAILMMALFHFLFDLNYLGFMDISLYTGFWGLFQKATISLFLILVGISITISRNSRKENFMVHMLNRAGFLFAVALLISAVTYSLFPQDWIYFGIMHMIAVSLLLSIPFSGKKISALIAGLAVILLPIFFDLQSLGLQLLFWLGFSRPQQAFDFVPIFPWFGVVLIGIYAGNVLMNHFRELDRFQLARNKTISWLGKNSLAIYLLHQPVIFGILFVIKTFIL